MKYSAVSEVQYITVEAAQRGRAEIRLKGKIRTILLPAKLCRKLLKYSIKEFLILCPRQLPALLPESFALNPEEFSHQRRKAGLPPPDLAGDENAVRKSRGGKLESLSSQPPAFVCGYVLQGLPGYCEAGTRLHVFRQLKRKIQQKRA